MQWKKKFNSTKTKQNIDGRTKKKDFLAFMKSYGIELLEWIQPGTFWSFLQAQFVKIKKNDKIITC